jgi:uncharacterized membrane protein YedE/YeeE
VSAAERLRRHVLWVTLVIAMALAREARAVVIVLDTCVIRCTEEDRRLIEEFRRVLGSRLGLAVAPSEVMEAIDDGMPRPAITTIGLTARKLADELRSGVDHWISGRYGSAEERLADAFILVKLNPELVMSDPSLRQLIPRAYVGWAVSLWRLGRRAKAREVIAELVRTLPEQSILESWGTEADKIFQLARKELEALGKGSLVVEVDDPSTIFYVNEAGQPQRALFAAMLYPGPYRILVQDARGRSRHFRIEVAANSTSMLRIRWRRDLQFSVANEHIGFVFESAAERVHEGDYARYFASLAKSDLAIVFGRISWRRRPAVVATIYRASDSSVLRAGVVSIQGDEAAALRELASFLVSQSASTSHVTRLAMLPWEEASAADGALGFGYPLGWGLAAGALAVGVTLRVTEGDSASHRYVGYALIGVGLAAGVGTTVLYLHRDSAPPQSVTAVMAPTRAGLFVAMCGRF